MTGTRCSSACNRSSADMSSILQHQQQNVQRLTTSCDQTRSDIILLSNSVTTPVLVRNDSNHRTACARSVKVHTSAVKSTSLQRTKSQSATPSGKPQDSGPHQPASTSTHVPSRAMSHVAQYHAAENECGTLLQKQKIKTVMEINSLRVICRRLQIISFFSSRNVLFSLLW